MSDSKEFLDLVSELLSDNPNSDVDMSMGTPLADGGLELTSLELIQLLVQLEERLDIKIPDNAVMNAFLDDVGDLFRLVDACSDAPAGQPTP